MFVLSWLVMLDSFKRVFIAGDGLQGCSKNAQQRAEI